jgi:hypothetical protein
MAQTYCVAADVEFVLSAAGVTACLDDGEEGVRSAEADDLLDRAIDVAAGKINQHVRHQYKLSDLTPATNTWLRDTNAYLAAKVLAMRRGNPCPESLVEEVKEREAALVEIRWGRESIPQQSPSFEHIPSVSNFRPELYKMNTPVRVDVQESIGSAPVDGAIRKTANGGSVY